MTEQSSTPEQCRPALPDVVGTAIVGVVGAAALITGFGYGFLQDDGQVGAGFVPAATGAFILLGSSAELVRMFFFSRFVGKSVAEQAEAKAKAAISDNNEHGERDASASDGYVGAGSDLATVRIFGLLLAALILIPVIGLLLALTAMVLAIVLWVERKPLVPALLTTAGVFAITYLIFVALLGIPLPEGVLGLI